jgi:hypothetical protein
MALGPAPQAQEDNMPRHLEKTDARQGVVSGRVVTVLIVSLLAVAAIFAVMWLMNANLSTG